MKKLLLVVFAMYYLALSAGINVHLHDCVEVFVTTVPQDEDDHSNPCTDSAQACNLEMQSSSNEVALKNSRSVTATVSPVLISSESKPGWSADFSKPEPLISTPESPEPLFILHRVFRI